MDEGLGFFIIIKGFFVLVKGHKNSYYLCPFLICYEDCLSQFTEH